MRYCGSRMDFRIIAAAKPSIAYARDGVKFFEERLRPLGRVELRYVKAGDSEAVSARLLEASEGCLRIAMDERGENWSTRELESRVRRWQMQAVKHVPHWCGRWTYPGAARCLRPCTLPGAPHHAA